LNSGFSDDVKHDVLLCDPGLTFCQFPGLATGVPGILPGAAGSAAIDSDRRGDVPLFRRMPLS
jgi:hypothetical protein